MRRVIVDMTKRGTVWMMALVFAASLLAAPAAMARKTGDQGPQKGENDGIAGFHRKIWFKEERGGGEKANNPGGSGGSVVESRWVISLAVLKAFNLVIFRR